MLPHHTGWIDVVDFWARPPLGVNGVLHSLDDKKAVVSTRSHCSFDLH
jgi:hypothetical protein